MWRKRSFPVCLCGLLCALVGAGCSNDATGTASVEDKTGASRPAESSTIVKPREPEVRSKFRLVRSLLKESSRAELRVGGPLIDFGSGDQYKYTRGDWGTGWAVAGEGAPSRALIDSRSASLNLFLSSSAKELVVRARSTKANQDLTVAAAKKKIGSMSLTEAWREVRLPLPELGLGRKKLSLTHSTEAAIEVDWLWLASEPGQDAPITTTKVAPLKIDGRLRRSLLAPGEQSYSYYLHPPDNSTLIFDYACKSGLEFVVRAQGVDGSITELFRKAGGTSWKTAQVDLSALSGQAVRLELATEGEGFGGGWGEPGIFIGLSVSPAKAAPKKAKNLVLVVLDTTRADQFETFTPGNGIHTPKLDAFSKRATSFTRAYNNSNWTKPSVLSMFSGLYPATHTATKPASMVPEGVELISEHLQKHGLKTQGFTANPVVSGKFGFERGWDAFSLFYKGEASGKAMYERAGRWVEENGDEPFFLYIQTIDPHTTYAVPKEYWSRYYKKKYIGPIGPKFTREDQSKVNDRKLVINSNDIAWIQALYHGEITYQDQHVGAFLDKLEELGRLEDTIVVVTNDHGEEIHDHGSFGHGWQLYEEMIRAPLMIHYPDLFPPATEIDHIVEHVDLAPTMVEALGLPPMKKTEGQSFLPMLSGDDVHEPRYAISTSDNGKRTVIIGSWKLIVTQKKGWKNLFDLSAADSESVDRRANAELAGRLCEIYMAEGMASPGKLQRQSGIGGKQRFEAHEAILDEATRKELEALGYL